MIVEGKIRSPGNYADGTERIEIWFTKEKFNELPAKVNQRVDIELEVTKKVYIAGIRHTERNNYIWISPDCYFEDKKVRLSNIILTLGFKINDNISIDFYRDRATIIPKGL